MYNENVQTSSLLCSTRCTPSVNTNIVFISWLIGEVYYFELCGDTSQNTHFDERLAKYVL